ncbi:LacI family DNA-binding transcriptional regulator [Actinopolymorpha pittospori]
MAAAAALGYVTSEIGRSLSTRATRKIGVVVSDLTNPYYPHLLGPLHDELDRLGYRMVVLAETTDTTTSLDRLLGHTVDGVVLTTTLIGSPLPHELARHSIPFVYLSRKVDEPKADSCVVDNIGGAELVGCKLLDLGHQRIGAIFGPERTSTSRDREAGFRGALADAGFALPSRMVRRGTYDYETGRTLMLELLDEHPRPTAVFCANDVLALGGYNAAFARGVAVPEQLTVIGFDDISMASWDVFQLTTVRHDLGTMTQNAGRLLAERIHEPDRPVRCLVTPAELVPRRTHAPCPISLDPGVSS